MTTRRAVSLCALLAAGCATTSGGAAHEPYTPDTDTECGTDTADVCPNNDEDWNAYGREAGCPEPDADGDGVPNSKDLCPHQAMVVPPGRTASEGRGCPDDLLPPITLPAD